RRKLDKLREGIARKEEGVDKKVASGNAALREKRKKVRLEIPRESKVKKKPSVTAKGPLREGEKVIMDGSARVGEVISVDRNKIAIAFGNIKTTVSASKVRRASEGEISSSSVKPSSNSRLDWNITRRRTRFSPDKDVRGLRAEAALGVVREFIDEAIMVQYPTLRILHGKGNGILRQLIREYLSTVDLVKDYYDDHVDAGGSGITVVELDL
ncbi:MAG TPA: Smr/MutS family protein, partial [Bacteroidales bacterium]|nr:Smr/MutS family protein [Bacteroidales bacterium]